MSSEQDRLPRKLAGILYADVVGYSRLTGEDEDSTHRVLGQYLDLIAQTVEKHRGRVMHYAGDAVLAMFEAAVDALSCAVEIQRNLKKRNSALPETRMVQFRIGVNLGDVIEDRGDIYGDGVNVAARLESIAEPGEICVSGIVHEAVFGKLDIQFESLGEKQVKNIARPVHVYRVLLEQEATGSFSGLEKPVLSKARIVKISVISAAIVFAVVLATWQPWKPDYLPVSIEKMAFPLPEKPSIALIPLSNEAENKADDAFSAAALDHLITKLGSLPEVFVISRDSSFELAQTPSGIHEVSERLGVRYVLQARYMTTEENIRIEAHLVDALDGVRLWFKSTEVRFDEMFLTLGEIAIDVASTLKISLTAGQKAALIKAPTNRIDAWRFHVQAHSEARTLSQSANSNARELWLRAIQHDPGFVPAWISLGKTYWNDVWFGWTEEPVVALYKAESSALRVLDIDPTNACAYRLLGGAYLFRSEFDKAIEFGVKATSLTPNDADALAMLAISQNFAGQPKHAEGSIALALRLNPFNPPWYFLPQAEAYRLSGRYEDAIRTVRQELRQIDSVPARIRLAIYYAQAGKKELAEAEVRKVLNERPKMTITSWSDTQKFKDPAQLEHDLASLQKAGMPAILRWECLVRDQCP